LTRGKKGCIITTVNEKVYVNLIRRYEYSRKAIIFGRIKSYVKSSSSERNLIHS
jgi:hypothetical protein